METVALTVVGLSAALLLYAYAGYPILLWLVGRLLGRRLALPEDTVEWPFVSLSIPAFNEASQMRDLIASLLALDYPRDKLQILIVSDASSDGTDEIVAEFADQGIDLLRMPERGGKNRAENEAARHLEGDIIVNTDASIRIAPDALKRLVAVFADPEIGCASGRDVSVGADYDTSNVGEGGYVGYEMAVRDLETAVSGIVGASGCFYAIRPHLHRIELPASLSRDFAAALHTREAGFRAVSVPGALCLVPRTDSLKQEYRRKVRTIARGMRTLWHKRGLMNPFSHPVFAWMLVSHKVCRWALPWGALATLVALGVLAPTYTLAMVGFGLGVVLLTLAGIGWVLSDRSNSWKIFSVPAFVVAGNLAAAHALLRALKGGHQALWEPTRRTSVRAG